MKFILVAAMAKNRVIGKDNWFPWDLPHEMEDMRGFIRGKTLVMWRKTCESIGRILPKRRNIVLTRHPEWVHLADFPVRQDESGNWIIDGGEKGIVEIYTSLEDVHSAISHEEEIIIFGGSEIYKLFLDDPRSEIRLSEIHGDYEGDTYFPEFENLYEEVSREPKEGYDVVWHKRKL